MNRAKYLIKNTGILAVSNFASKILIFLLVPLYTSVLSTTEYGTYDLVVSTITMLVPILTCNIADAVMRFSMDAEYQRDEIAKIGLKYIGYSIVSAWVLLALVKILNLWPIISGLELLIGTYFIFNVFNQFLVQMAKGYERVADMGVAGVLGTVVMVSTNIFFLLVLKKGLKGFFVANTIAQAVPATYLLFRLKIIGLLKQKIQKKKKLEREMLAYCVPLIATTLGWWVNSTADRYVVALMCGVAANGLLSISYKIPTIINTLQGIFIQAWQISAIKEYGEKDTALFYGRAFEIINTLMCIACACLGSILYQKEFYYAWQYVPFLLVSCVLNSASGFLGPILAAKKDSRSMALSAVYGACANVLMNIGLVYLIGIQGATIATVISSFIIYCVRKRAVGSEISIVRYQSVLLTWFLLCIQAVFEIYTSLWWVEIILMIIMLILNLNGVKQVLTIGKNFFKRCKKT